MKTLDLHITDIFHNSLRAKAKQIVVEIKDSDSENIFSLTIKDDGCGIDGEKLKAINESFFSSRKERKIGMGLALLKHQAESCNGSFSISSEVGKGTDVVAVFQKNHIDRQPSGDIAGSMATFICQFSEINIVFRYVTDNDEFELSTEDIKSVFDKQNLNDFKIISAIKEMIFNSINP